MASISFWQALQPQAGQACWAYACCCPYGLDRMEALWQRHHAWRWADGRLQLLQLASLHLPVPLGELRLPGSEAAVSLQSQLHVLLPAQLPAPAAMVLWLSLWHR